MRTTYYGVFCEYFKNGERKFGIITREAIEQPKDKKKITPICLATEYWTSIKEFAEKLKGDIEKCIASTSDMLAFDSGYRKAA